MGPVEARSNDRLTEGAADRAAANHLLPAHLELHPLRRIGLSVVGDLHEAGALVVVLEAQQLSLGVPFEDELVLRAAAAEVEDVGGRLLDGDRLLGGEPRPQERRPEPEGAAEGGGGPGGTVFRLWLELDDLRALFLGHGEIVAGVLLEDLVGERGVVGRGGGDRLGLGILVQPSRDGLPQAVGGEAHGAERQDGRQHHPPRPRRPHLAAQKRHVDGRKRPRERIGGG